MKTLLIRGVVAVFLGLPVIFVSAQTQSTASSSTSYIETSKFIGKKVKSPQGDEIGTVKDIVLDRNTGCLAYTVVSTAEGSGARVSGGSKMVAVPWAVYSPSSDLNVLTITVDKDRIYNAPAFDYARIDEYSRPEYISNVYSYYGVSGGAAAGSAVSGSGATGTTTTTGASTTTGTATTSGAASGGAASAGASQGGRSGPPETPSRAAQSSPGPRSTPAATGRTQTGRTHATASPNTRSHEAGTPPTKRMRGSTDTGPRSETDRGQPEQSNERETNARTRESRPETEESETDRSGAAERATGTRHREKTGKRETSSPPDQPEQRQ